MKRKLIQRIKHKIKNLLGYYKLHYKVIKGGCPACGADLIVCEVSVMCSNYRKFRTDPGHETEYKCNYWIVAG